MPNDMTADEAQPQAADHQPGAIYVTGATASSLVAPVAAPAGGATAGPS